MSSESIRQTFAGRHDVLTATKERIKLRRGTPGIPKCANFGWLYLPLATRVQIFAVLFGAIALSTPFWVSVYTDMLGYMTFGLWHLCIGAECTSIHDNIVPGRDVPAWYILLQGTYSIGIAGSCISLGILTHTADDDQLRMSPTTHRAAFCILCITVLQQFVGIYTFLTYVEETDFLFEKIDWELDFHGSFYCALLGLALCMVTTMMVYLDDEITKPKKKKVRKYQPKYDLNQDMVLRNQQKVLQAQKKVVQKPKPNPVQQYMERPSNQPIMRQPHNYNKVHLS